MNNFFITIVFLFTFFTIHAQNLGKHLTFGTSITFILDNPTSNPSDFFYKEWSWNKNIAVSLTNRWDVGISHINIYTVGSSLLRERYQLVGLFTQYNFSPKKKNKLFAETSWHLGNYCTCGLDDPYKLEKLNYLGIGGGYELNITKNLYLDLAFNTYFILKDVPRKYNYTQYVVGLNYRLF